jgi:serine/threonine-protein kinase
VDEQFERLKSALADRYRVERLVGEGGMALVYLATDLRHDRQVALKTLRPELAASLGADRFLEEIRLIAKLNHPHVLALFDSGEADGMLYYVMPFIDGVSLAQRLRAEKQLPIDEAVRIAREVAAALGHAHSRGLVHRDIKPDNILLLDGHAIVADFGISRAVKVAGGERLTQTGMAIGTPEYMSPEQVAGDPDIDARSDVYSLGCVLYEMLVGQIPFPAPTLQAMMARHTMEPPPSPTVMRAATPPDIERIVVRAMAKNPVDRFMDGADLERALAGDDADTAVTAQQPAPIGVLPAKPTRSVPRARALLLAVAAAALVALPTWWLAGRLDRPPVAIRATPTLAVLPFENAGADPNDDYFAVGLESELIDVLSGIDTVTIAGRRSTRAFRGSAERPAAIGRRLGVTAVLTAEVGKSGDQLVITATLVNAADGLQLWSNRFELTVADVYEAQEQIARAVVAQLGTDSGSRAEVLSIDAPTTNLMAHDKYLWGEFNLDRRTREGASDAVDNFTMSIGFDAAYAEAYAGLAEAQLALLSYAREWPNPDLLEGAAQAALAALQLDPNLARAHAALGLVDVHRFEWDAAEEEYVRALELDPQDSLVHQRYAELLAAVGRFVPALTQAERAVEQDRLSTGALRTLLRTHRAHGNTAEAIRDGQRMLDLNVNDPAPWLDLALLFLADGRYGDAVNAMESYAERSRMDEAPFRAFIAAAEEHAASGAVGTVPADIRDLLFDRPVQLAVLNQLAGRDEDALVTLERAHQDRHPDLADLIMRPELAPLYDAPRFRAIAADIGLTVPTTR